MKSWLWNKKPKTYINQLAKNGLFFPGPHETPWKGNSNAKRKLGFPFVCGVKDKREARKVPSYIWLCKWQKKHCFVFVRTDVPPDVPSIRFSCSCRPLLLRKWILKFLKYEVLLSKLKTISQMKCIINFQCPSLCKLLLHFKI